MKLLFAAVLCTVITAASTNAQTVSPAPVQLLELYYDIKNALVNADAATASAKAADFVKLANNIDTNTLPATIKKKLVAEAQQIQTAKDIATQRAYFAGFSLDVWSLANSTKIAAQPVYQQYCPMKKAYWLANEAAIKNPYYGKSMLTCGSITATIKP